MDVLADLVFSVILEREVELLELRSTGESVGDELEVVRALLRLIYSESFPRPPLPLQ